MEDRQRQEIQELKILFVAGGQGVAETKGHQVARLDRGRVLGRRASIDGVDALAERPGVDGQRK